MKLYFLLIFSIVYNISFSQDFQKNFQPLTTSTENTAVLESIEKRYDKDKGRITKKTKHFKKKKIFYKERYERLTGEIRNGAIITEPSVTGYFQNIFDEISNANPVIREQDVRLLVYRSEAPNASCHGEGTIYLNIGLINRFANEGEIAFVIAHEVAHYMKNHVDRAVTKSMNQLYSKETKTELDKIKRSEYLKVTKATELLQGYVYDSRKHSRFNEEQADAVAIEYLKKTKYNAFAAISTLEMLDKVELFKYDEPIEWKKHFSSTTYPFKERWITPDGAMSFNIKNEDGEWDAELLKTHPDCEIRIAAAKTLLTDYDETGKKLFIQSEEIFNNISIQSDFEIIEQAFNYRDLDLAFYYTLQMLEKYPDNVYLKTMVGKTLYIYFRSREDHNTTKYVDKPNAKIDKNYNEVLTFFSNLRTKEIGKVMYYYFNEQDASMLKNEDFFYYYVLSVAMKGDPEELKVAKVKFNQNFPDSQRKDKVEILQVFLK